MHIMMQFYYKKNLKRLHQHISQNNTRAKATYYHITVIIY